jgi:hypothetical protein
MSDTQYPTSNLVIPQLHQMMVKLEIPIMTYAHTTQKETIPVHTSLAKEMMKGILKTRTQMVKNMYV